MAVRRVRKEKLARIVGRGEATVPATPAKEVATFPAGEEASINDFGRLAFAMSRLLTEFSQVKPLRDAGLGLGDWAVLALLAQSDGMAKRLSRSLGIPIQRVASIVASLGQDELVSVEPSAGEGKATTVIKITEAGRTKLEAVNAELATTLGAVLRSRSLNGALKHISALGPLLRAVPPEKA